MKNNSSSRVLMMLPAITWKPVMVAAAVSAMYMLVSFLLIGFKTDQLVLASIFSVLYVLSVPTRKFILGFSIFIVFWIIFDYMKAFPNYLFNNVHIKDLYHAELYSFGIHTEGIHLTPNEFFRLHHVVWADVLAGIFYLCWVPVPLAFAAFLFFKERQQFLYFSLTFLLVNLLGFVVYYIYPAAPPWYIQHYGFDFHAGTPGNTAGLLYFDKFFGITLFQGMYAKSSNVFAAMPSLHSAYPLIVTYYGIRNKLGWVNVIFVVITVGIWLAAVYTSHHYVLDVLAGVAIATIGITLFNQLVKKNSHVKKFVGRYQELIS